MDIFGELSLFGMFLKINQNTLTQAKILIKCLTFERSKIYYLTLGLTGTLEVMWVDSFQDEKNLSHICMEWGLISNWARFVLQF